MTRRDLRDLNRQVAQLVNASPRPDPLTDADRVARILALEAYATRTQDPDALRRLERVQVLLERARARMVGVNP